eukprot:CAMPEP_0176317528 /NCGR_PEP_ID=MMETSP0121_2-20121125/69297_1 /TAXON_ID=160619 /ORGANISM="Kryptoperidinium foliaceum, Strain CCMP 1326" /LENGTH=53 /DNA_ID=CAMNT_0017659777 /DNA_START=160 /DNA_END=321 /DNA_ORIENTATION=+
MAPNCVAQRPPPSTSIRPQHHGRNLEGWLMLARMPPKRMRLHSADCSGRGQEC